MFLPPLSLLLLPLCLTPFAGQRRGPAPLLLLLLSLLPLLLLLPLLPSPPPTTGRGEAASVKGRRRGGGSVGGGKAAGGALGFLSEVAQRPERPRRQHDGLEDRRPAIHNNNNNSSLRKEGGSQRRAGAARGEEPAGGGLHARSAAHGTRAASLHGSLNGLPVLHCNPAVNSVVVHSQTVRARRRARTLS